MTYKTNGTCSQAINFEIVDGKLHNVEFVGGCDGNTHGICRLVEGMKAEDVIKNLSGIDCNGKGTSCPDQLAKAVEKALAQNK